ncbi:MAG: Uma2 family endonuclease [Armatimonadetes bacterium]|nr:Uma2 family endonuclease [Armatimonadota bacterium]
MTQPAKSYITPEEYLALEREAEIKNEYYNGEMFAMAGGSRYHDRITDDFMGELRLKLLDGPCETHTGNMRVKVSPTGLYTYPDGSVVCGEAEYEDGGGDTLLNPILILEVLSPSTELYDRKEKFDHYQTIPTLIYYVLIAQDRPRVEIYARQDDGTWNYKKTTGLEAEVELPALSFRLAMSEIYRRVTFPPEAALREQTA